MMLAVVAIWAFAEAAVFFIVADVPIMAVGLRHGIKRALIAALAASVMAALGGMALYGWARADPAGCRAVLLALPGISAVLVEQAGNAYGNGGYSAMLIGSFMGVPYKLYAYGAAMQGDGLIAFFLGSVCARLPRFALMALVAGWLGPALRSGLLRRLHPRAIWGLFLAGWGVFYIWYFNAMGA